MFTRPSIRLRLFFGMASMLLPLLLASVISYVALGGVIEALDEVVEESIQEVAPVVHLQKGLHRVAISLHDELVYGEVFEEDRDLDALVAEVEKRFRKGFESPFEDAAERVSLEQAYEHWKAALAVASRAGAEGSTRIGPLLAEEMRELDFHIDQASRSLDDIQAQANREIEKALDYAATVRARTGWLTLVTFGLATLLAVVFGILLARTILLPLRELEQGAERLGRGELSYRVAVVHKDEIGRLAALFNRMARRLEQSYHALKRLSIRDYLTGMNNAREFHRLLREEAERSRRYESSFSLALIDVDHFKRINDRYGHQVGDGVLREVAQKIRTLVRRVDLPARIGGEEFAVILPETGPWETLALAERMRASLAKTPIVVPGLEGEPLAVTVSIGVATFPQQAHTEKQLFAEADKALYQAKRDGRNLVRQAPEEERGEGEEIS